MKLFCRQLLCIGLSIAGPAALADERKQSDQSEVTPAVDCGPRARRLHLLVFGQPGLRQTAVMQPRKRRGPGDFSTFSERQKYPTIDLSHSLRTRTELALGEWFLHPMDPKTGKGLGEAEAEAALRAGKIKPEGVKRMVQIAVEDFQDKILRGVEAAHREASDELGSDGKPAGVRYDPWSDVANEFGLVGNYTLAQKGRKLRILRELGLNEALRERLFVLGAVGTARVEPNFKSTNPYEVLGLTEAASAEEIQAAYRDLAKKHHPDRRGNHEDMQAINLAWDALRDGAAPKQAVHETTQSQSAVAPEAKAEPRERGLQIDKFLDQFKFPDVQTREHAKTTILQFNALRGKDFAAAAEAFFKNVHLSQSEFFKIYYCEREHVRKRVPKADPLYIQAVTEGIYRDYMDCQEITSAAAATAVRNLAQGRHYDSRNSVLIGMARKHLRALLHEGKEAEYYRQFAEYTQGELRGHGWRDGVMEAMKDYRDFMISKGVEGEAAIHAGYDEWTRKVNEALTRRRN